MASTMASTLALSRPSEKFGTHSTSVDIGQKNSWGRRMEARRRSHTTCHPERRRAGREAARTTESKDPLHLFSVLGSKGFFAIALTPHQSVREINAMISSLTSS